jgi:L-cystine uptake protein TcyP (sodium:dicarboxylate symporter family)
MAPLEMPKSFRFCQIFPIHNLTHELTANASSSQFASLTSLNPRSKCVVYNFDSTSGIELEMVKKDEQRKKHKLYEISKKFQDIWMTKLPWA